MAHKHNTHNQVMKNDILTPEKSLAPTELISRDGTINPFSPPIASGSFNNETDSFNYKREASPEIQARLEKDKKDSDVDRWIKITLFAIVVLFSLAGLIIGFILILDEKSSTERVQIGWSLITLILGAFFGFFTGKSKLIG